MVSTLILISLFRFYLADHSIYVPIFNSIACDITITEKMRMISKHNGIDGIPAAKILLYKENSQLANAFLLYFKIYFYSLIWAYVRRKNSAWQTRLKIIVPWIFFFISISWNYIHEFEYSKINMQTYLNELASKIIVCVSLLFILNTK